MDYKMEYEQWIASKVFDEETKKELLEIKNNEEEIKERFYKNLEFGTAGLRGIMGSGTNRMNKYTVTKATQGLANYIKIEKGEDKGVAIAYDSRHHSKEFAEYTALCLNANGIKTYLFEDVRSTPELSFAVRELKCISGIIITASHNPPQYNGYKVYWEDGAQITYPKDNKIITEVNKIVDYALIKMISKEEAIKLKLFNIIGKEIDDKYVEAIKRNLMNMDAIEKQKDKIKIVYTPLHGTGALIVKRVLSELGFKNLYIVPEQEKPNGDFPTVKFPNPEEKEAFKLALNLAKEKDADLVLASDPDADRFGVYVKNEKTNEYQRFTGNMVGVIFTEYLLSQKSRLNKLPTNGAIIKTIVSTEMVKEIAKSYGVEVIEILTGCKYIGEKIRQFEQTKKNEYIFGFEESFGCLIGTQTRDKDGMVAVTMFAEMAAYYKEQGKSLWEQMIHIYEKYGFYKEESYSIVLPGADGAEKIKMMMTDLRQKQINKIGEYEVLEVRDYNLRKKINMKTKEAGVIELPKSNVLYYALSNNAWCCVRPSGTEPKIKLYMGIKASNFEEADKKIEELKKEFKKIIKQLSK